jgi:hypothetical protein
LTHGSGILWPNWAPARRWLEEVAVTLRSALSERTAVA